MFVQSAAAWLTTFDDPAPVLLNLAGPVSQTLGPWETFRHACLLGLYHASSVKALAEDVVAEPLGADTPPVAAARALAHARDRFALPLDGSRHRPLCARLSTISCPGPAEDAARQAAVWSLSAALGETDDDARAAAEALLTAPDAPTFALAVAEAGVLTGADARPALEVVWAGQQPDGGLSCGAGHELVRGLYTLRTLALEARLAPPR